MDGPIKKWMNGQMDGQTVDQIGSKVEAFTQ